MILIRMFFVIIFVIYLHMFTVKVNRTHPGSENGRGSEIY